MLLIAILTLLTAFAISSVAAYVSVTGMMALFPAAGFTIIVLMSSLEVGKLVGASWLKLNWVNARVNKLHRTLLTTIVIVLMAITSLGMYGFLSKGYLEQSTPVAGVELQIAQKEQEVKMLQTDNERLQKKLDQLDANIAAFLKGDKAERANSVLTKQKVGRHQIENEIKANNDKITKLNQDILPLKVQTAGVEAKLGPIKYVAELFGWKDPSTAVRMIILMLIFVSDPLAVLLLLSAQVSFIDWLDGRKKKPESVVNDKDKVTTSTPEEISASDNVVGHKIESPDMIPDFELEPLEPVAPRDETMEPPKKKRGGNRRKKVVPSVPTPEEAHEVYQSSLKRLATAYMGGDQELPIATTEDKQKLIEILETRPELLGTLIDVIREEDKTTETKVQVPRGEIVPEPESPTTITTNVPQEQLSRNLKPTSWLGRPKS